VGILHYQTLINDCIEEMDRPLAEPCLKTKFCRMAGECQDCSGKFSDFEYLVREGPMLRSLHIFGEG